MAEKEEAIFKKDHQDGMQMAVFFLEEFGLPLGLLPLTDVIEVGFVRSTGYMWILQKKKFKHNFKMISKLMSYYTEMTGYGVKAKELMLWPLVSQISVDNPPTGKIQFMSLTGIIKTFPVEAFAGGR
ncbi:hypothetical protein RGQ29_020305 [Quercus rubra]|uniref:Uncharacterized protein n=1 Tax=Quercus rubra TaxID=3512 RepID=A0AAN7FFA6_QUERU|nr:hypothetical protein RGQ29_020305 [Quercus rubra]